MFQGLRQGGMFYILDKCEDMKLKIGQVVSVSNPQPKANQFGASYQYALPNELFVDVKVKVGEDTFDFNNHTNIGNPYRGLLIINLAQAIPSGSTSTLPIVFTSEGGNVQPLTKIGGVAVTAADITDSGIYIAWFDHSTSTLQLLTGVV